MSLSAHVIEERRQGCALGHQVVFANSLPSTQGEAQRLLEDGAAHGTLIVAERQTAGRGRRGNKWFSEEGGLYFSLVLKPDLPPERMPRITLLSGAAIVEALMGLGADAWAKWPNDVLLSAGSPGPLGPFRKVGGVLSELISGPTGITGVALGVGLNLLPPKGGFPEELNMLAGTLQSAGLRQKPVDVLCSVLDRLEERLTAPGEEQGFLDALDVLRTRSATLGRSVTVDEELEGTATEIDEDGALIVTDADGKEHRVIAGDVQPG